MSTASRFLVTGANGFLGQYTTLRLLQSGHIVRGTAQTEEQIKRVVEHPVFKPFVDNKKLSFRTIDLLGDSKERWVETVADVDAIIHHASPYHLNGTHGIKDYVEPAVQGNLSILRAAAAQPSVKHVIATSSSGGLVTFDPVRGPFQDGKVYDEMDYNGVTLEDIEKDPTNAILSYFASKKYAELAAWEFIQDKKPHFKFTTFTPPVIIGPSLLRPSTVAALPTSSKSIIYPALSLDSSVVELPVVNDPNVVDVRDVAEAHVRAWELGKEGRFIVAGGLYDNQLLADVFHRYFPELSARMPVGKPGTRLQGVFSLSTKKARRELDFKPRPVEESLRDEIAEVLEVEKSDVTLV